MGLNRAVMERVESMAIEDPLTKRIHIKMSGCPNGCSQHHIANIGFYGASIKVGGHTIPAYVAHIGGNYEGGEVIYGTRLKVRLPAKRVPDAVERWIRMYEAEREEGEVFNAFAERVGQKRFEDEVRELSLPVDFTLENLQLLHRLDQEGAVPGGPGRGRMRSLTVPDLEGLSAHEVLAEAVERHHPSLVMACSFQKEESVLIDISDEHRTVGTRVHDRHRCPLPRDVRGLAQVEERYGLHIEVMDATSPSGTLERRALLRPAQGRRARAGARRRRRLDHRHPPRAVADAGERAQARLGLAAAGYGSSTRSPTGPRRTSGTTCSSTTSPTTRCTIAATLRSAALPAPCPAQAATAAGPGRTRRSAVSTYERR